MDLKNQDFSFLEDKLDDSAYLTSAQCDLIRERVERGGNGTDNEEEIMKLIDDFVRANGKDDEKYKRLKKLADESLDLFLGDLDYPSHVKMAFFPISLMAYFNLLLLLGVYKKDELTFSMKQAGNGGWGNTNNQA